MKSNHNVKTMSIKAIGFTPDQLTDEPAIQKALSQRDVIALEQLHLLLSKVRLLCKERLTQDGINHLYEIADVGHKIPLRIRNEIANNTDSACESAPVKLSRYDREILILNNMLYQRLDKKRMFENHAAVWRNMRRYWREICLLSSGFAVLGFIIGRIIP